MGAAEEVVLVTATFATRDEAEHVGEGAVNRRLAACGNVVPTVHSFFYWEGRLQRQHEAMLVLKTVRSRFEELQEFIRTHSSYELPEVVMTPVAGGLPAYLEWVIAEVRDDAFREEAL